uniref:Uncharacterized protein n=1 Tax=Salix viminalis TaxID=40686 RepID=A0A6N2L142_SALVM
MALLRPLQITGIAEDCWCVGLRKRKLVLGESSFVTIQELSYDSPRDEIGLWKAVRNVHYMIDKEIAAGALTLLTSVLLYPKTLGGGAVFSGCVPLSSSIMEQATPDVKRLQTPIPWLHGVADRTVLFEAGQTEPHFLEQAAVLRCYILISQYFLFAIIQCMQTFFFVNKQRGVKIPGIVDQGVVLHRILDAVGLAQVYRDGSRSFRRASSHQDNSARGWTCMEGRRELMCGSRLQLAVKLLCLKTMEVLQNAKDSRIQVYMEV